MKLWCPGCTYAPGDRVTVNGATWIALLRTGYQPGENGHWTRWMPTSSKRQRRAAPPAGHAAPFPPVAESRERAAALVADALKRAAADPVSSAKTIFPFNGQTIDIIAAADVAVFTAADAESRERDQRLSADLAELRRRIEAS
jgi:hypothetical protein